MVLPTLLASYLVVVNVAAGSLFIADKFSARLHTWRIPEWLLHLLEALGGALLVLPLIFLLPHKRAKPSYYLRTIALFGLWIGITLTFLLF